jgi:hypothetical protein
LVAKFPGIAAELDLLELDLLEFGPEDWVVTELDDATETDLTFLSPPPPPPPPTHCRRRRGHD